MLTSAQTSITRGTPLFIVGNGNAATSRTKAMVVYKNGITEMQRTIIGGGTLFIKEQGGTQAAGTSATQLKQVTITFPTAFLTVPKITITPRCEPGTNNNDVYMVTVRSISASSVTVNLLRVDVAAGWGQNVQLDWFAWEQL